MCAEIDECVNAFLARPIALAHAGNDSQSLIACRSTATNPLERLNAEIKRRINVVGIVSSEAAITRLIGALLPEQNDGWQLQRRYLPLEGLQALAENQTARLSAVVN